MKLNIAIVDDESSQTEYLADLVSEWAVEKHNVIRTQSFSSSESFLFAYEDDNMFDILLLDIEMGEMNGITLARCLREDNRRVQIIFVTGYFDYISDGYDVSALHYLLKPATSEKLFPVMDRAIENLASQEPFLVVSSSGQTVRIPQHDIVYIESLRNYSRIVCTTSSFKVRIPISKLESRLDDTFYRCGRSFIAGLRHIRKISKTTVTVAGDLELPLARNNYEEINRALIERL